MCTCIIISMQCGCNFTPYFTFILVLYIITVLSKLYVIFACNINLRVYVPIKHKLNANSYYKADYLLYCMLTKVVRVYIHVHCILKK